MPNLREERLHPESYKGLGPENWLGNVASGAGTGATVGSMAGPIGTAAGAIIGAGVGLGESAHQDSMLRAAEQQQRDLDLQLADQSQHDRYLQMFGQTQSLHRSQEELAAQQAAARAGLSPGEAEAMRQAAVYQNDLISAQQLPGLFLQSTQDEMMRRQQVMNEYQGAQALANNAMGDQSGWMNALAGLAGAAGEYGGMNKDTSKYVDPLAAMKETPPPQTIEKPTLELPALPDTGTPAVGAWAPSGGVPGTGVGRNPPQVPQAGNTTPVGPEGQPGNVGPGTAPAPQGEGLRSPYDLGGYEGPRPATGVDVHSTGYPTSVGDPFSRNDVSGLPVGWQDLSDEQLMQMYGQPQPSTVQQVEQARSTGNYDDLFPEDIRRK